MGQGGFKAIYKGQLRNGIEIVKFHNATSMYGE
jgi:hypothetical protein